MEPMLHDGVYAYCSVPLDAEIAAFSPVVTVHSDLEAVGLTAAFSTALGQAGIACNVVAGA